METNRNVDIVRLFWEFSLSENQCGMIGEVVGCSLLVVGNAKIGYLII